MDYKFTIDPEAATEYIEAIHWYLERSISASKNFHYAVEEKIRDICEHPLQYRKTKKIFREALLKKYPFSIVYTIDEATHSVTITSIFHHKKNPKRKYRKLN